MKYAVVDLGSNSICMSIYDKTDKDLKRFLSQKEIIGLVEYTKQSILLEAGITRIIETLQAFLDTARIIGTDCFCCFATASLRNIDNSEDVLRKVNEETGVAIHIISGEEESRLDFSGAIGSLDFQEGLMADMGGGSTEIIQFQNNGILNLISLPFGSLYLYKKYVKTILPSKKEIKCIEDFAAKQLAGIEWLAGSSQKICLIGGTARAVARLHQVIFLRGKESLHGYTFPVKELKPLFDAIGIPESTGIKLITRVCPERIHTIIPGLIALSKIMEISGCQSITISRNGVREGYLEKYVLNR